MNPSHKHEGEYVSDQKSKPRGKSRGRADLLEWHVYEDEAKWQESQQASLAASSQKATVANASGALQRWWFVPAAVLVVALVAAVAWVQAQRGLETITAEVQGAVAVDAWLSDHATDVQGMEIIELGQGWARVRVIVQPPQGGSAYRQTRVYRQQGAGWLRVEPGAKEWGRAAQLESQYFIFRYFAQDEEAVAATAPVLDAIYPTFHAALLSNGASIADAVPATKIVVVVDPTVDPVIDQELDQVTGVQEGAPDAALTLPSPSATLAPLEVTEEELLVQGAALALFDHLAAQSDVLTDLPPEWQPLQAAVRLWLMWDQGLPLARWRKPLVRWVFWEDGGMAVDGGATIPAFVPELCAHHHLWMSTMAEMELPVRCFSRPHGKDGMLALRYPIPPPLTLPALAAIPPAMSTASLSSTTRPPLPSASVVAFATFFEYISKNYGADQRGATQVRAILSVIPDHENWETLLPAHFGLSRVEFERGWNAYLSDQYGVGR